MKLIIALCVLGAALVVAEPEPQWRGRGWGGGWGGYGYRGRWGKRSADSESEAAPEAKPEADPQLYYRGYYTPYYAGYYGCEKLKKNICGSQDFKDVSYKMLSSNHISIVLVIYFQLLWQALC